MPRCDAQDGVHKEAMFNGHGEKASPNFPGCDEGAIRVRIEMVEDVNVKCVNGPIARQPWARRDGGDSEGLGRSRPVRTILKVLEIRMTRLTPFQTIRAGYSLIALRQNSRSVNLGRAPHV